MIARLIVICGIMVLATGCISPQQPIAEPTPAEAGDERVTLEGCMETVRRSSSYDGPVLAALSRRLSRALFYCQYFEGEKIEVLGKSIPLPGERFLVAGYGYALADYDPLLTQGKIGKELRRASGIQHQSITITVHTHVVSVPGYGEVPVYKLRVSHDFGISRIMGALAVKQVFIEHMPYTLFLWVQGGRLTNLAIVTRFRKLLPLVLAPREIAEE